MEKSKKRLTEMVKTSGCAAKLPPSLLHSVIDNLPLMKSDRLLEGFESADDALVYLVTDDIVSVQTVDFFPPMVDDPFTFGEVAAANALSDIYAMGGEPNVAMNLLCFPSCLDLSVMDQILRGGIEKVKEAGAVIAGGHTISDPTPKYGLCVTSFMKKDDIWSNTGAREGDVIVLTKALGVGIINTAAKGGEAGEESVKAAIDSMTRLNKKARDTARPLRVHAATDITGFSLMGHSTEVANGSGVTLVIDSSSLPVLPGALELARFGFLPEGMYHNLDYCVPYVKFSPSLPQNVKDLSTDPQTSGGLLLTMPEEDAVRFTEEYNEDYVRIIGEVKKRGDWAVELK
jgi:selenide, water dikinase